MGNNRELRWKEIEPDGTLRRFLTPEMMLFKGEAPKGWACECGSTTIRFLYQVGADLIFDTDGSVEEVGAALCVATPESCVKCGETDKLFEFRERTASEKLEGIMKIEQRKPDEGPKEGDWRL